MMYGTPTAPGTYPALDFDSYRAADAVANSDLKVIAQRSPAHFYAERLDPEREPEAPSTAKIEGAALHCALLEPNDFDQRYVYVPDDAPRDLRHLRNAKKPSDETLAAIEWWDRFDAGNAGKVILKRAAADEVRRCADRMRQHPELRPFLDMVGYVEESRFAHDPETGVLCKVRNDKRLRIGGYNAILDLKSCDDVREEWFRRAAYNFGYFQGAAFYSDVNGWCGDPIDTYIFVAFERAAPNAIKLYEPDEDALFRGRNTYRRALAIYNECRMNNNWPAYDASVTTIGYPAYAKE